MKSKRTYVDYLHDMLDHVQKAERFLAGVDFDTFCANDEKILAVVRALEIIGEAARHLPESMQQRYAEVPWRNIIGMRNVLIHRYFGVDLEVVWETVQRDLPPLRAAVTRMLADLEAEEPRG
jgi:uncharacterized protein with HEPN domain